MTREENAGVFYTSFDILIDSHKDLINNCVILGIRTPESKFIDTDSGQARMTIRVAIRLLVMLLLALAVVLRPLSPNMSSF